MANELDLKINVDEKSLTSTYGQFTIKPLDRGYGVTIGNALRRTLLTNLPGAAITNIKIEGVLHELATLPGIKDDVANIIMNLKGVRFKLLENNVDKVSINLKGKKVVTAKDIQNASDQFEILNPDHYITEINSSGSLEMDLWIGIGKGYVPSEENELQDSPIGMISIDSIFNPVKKVTFNVTALPGAKEATEVLNLQVHTDGAISPKDAVSYSASVLIQHLKVVESISVPEVLQVTDSVSDEVLNIRKLLNASIDEMELSVRSYNCLQAAGIKLIHELVSKDESEMLKYKNFGRKSLTELVEKLDEMGLSFGMDVEQYLTEEI